jgi:RNA polymerase sigma-70 factor (ECF subfamily)
MRPLASYQDPPADDVLPALELAPEGGSAPAGAGNAGPVVQVNRDARLRAMVDGHIEFVARVLRNAGTPQSEIDDQVQRTFIVAARRLDDVRLGSEKSFLFRIALNLAAHMRRTLARRREVPGDHAPERVESLATPEHLTDRKRMRELLDRVLDQMDGNLRDVFVLHEFEELNMSEIATVLGIPRGTVASRLRRARAEFRARVGALEDVMATRRGR